MHTFKFWTILNLIDVKLNSALVNIPRILKIYFKPID